MKKLYTAIAALACMASLNAATALTAPAEAKAGAGAKSTATLKAVAGTAVEATKAAGRLQSPAKAPETGEWTELGQGTWFEDLFATPYGVCDPGTSWTITIEQNSENPGWYRMIPYNDDSVLAQILGAADDVYLYVNATDPAQVYAEDFIPYGAFMFSQMVPENGWGGTSYGTLSDNVITFPARSWAYYDTDAQGWYYANSTAGAFKIALPGAEVKDYAFKVTSPYCASTAAGEVPVTFAIGADVASVKYIALPGYYTCDLGSSNATVVATNGSSLTLPEGQSSATYTIPAPEGINTMCAVGLNAAGEVVAGTATHYVGLADDAENWVSVGTAKLNEGVYSVGYSDVDAGEYEVEVEESLTEPGRYRVVNAFGVHPSLGQYNIEHDAHTHYLMVNATNPEQVYIEPSVTGVDLSYGDGLVWSLAHRYLLAGNTADAVAQAGYFGKKEGNVITMPDNTLLLGEKNYQNGALLQGNTDFKLTLPEQDGISAVAAVADKGAVEYFNLQGQRIAQPKAGELVIVRRGATVEKAVIR